MGEEDLCGDFCFPLAGVLFEIAGNAFHDLTLTRAGALPVVDTADVTLENLLCSG
jgi:hypothetical protein